VAMMAPPPERFGCVGGWTGSAGAWAA